jgi:hypothetical protein
LELRVKEFDGIKGVAVFIGAESDEITFGEAGATEVEAEEGNSVWGEQWGQETAFALGSDVAM